MKKILILLGLLVAAAYLRAQDFEVLFTKNIGGTDQLFAINQSGEEKQITKHHSKDSSPMLSPDGKYIVFTSERVGWWEIWLMNIQEGSFDQLTNSGSAEYSPCWSPDGSRILFISSRTGNAEVFSMNANGSELTQLTDNKTNDTSPFWAADDKIYYAAEVNGTYQIMKMDSDGSGKTQLTFDKGDKLSPQLNPTTQSILYYSNQDGNPEIYICDIDGQNAKRLTDHPLQDIRPRWSSDGRLIVFERGDKRRNQHIFIMDADGSNQKQITFANYNYAPSFVTTGTFLKKEK